MKVQPIRSPLASVEVQILAIGLFDGDFSLPSSLRGTPLGETLARLVENKEISRSVGEVMPLLGLLDSGLAAKSVVLFGLGPIEKFDEGMAFTAGVALSKKLASKPRESLAITSPEVIDQDTISSLVEGAIVGTRGPDLRKTEKSKHPFGSLTIIAAETAPSSFEAAVERGRIVGEAINLARDLANTPPAEKSPTSLAHRAKDAGESAGLKVTVWDRAKIEAERFGGLLGVAAGSEEPPAFVILEHLHGGDVPTLALVGKGVTFDSGGLSLKPSASMEDMKSDMTGAAVVVATMQAAARLALPVNITGYLAITENMTGGKAMKLGDVLAIRNGKTVEVMNTDAEGRLILADALSYAVEHKPDRVLDLATLTGACMVALGPRVAGLFSNDDAFRQDLMDACKKSGERAWSLPLDDDFKEQLKSHVADLKNVGGKWGGAITAAKFLEQFVGTTPWIHLDIAGPSWSDSESATRDAGGTGCFVRTLVAYLEATIRPSPW
jgi:leucyl aminopeptidase